MYTPLSPEKVSVIHESPLTLKEVADYLPMRRGRKIHYSTIFRWATKGTRGRILETTLVGGIRYTTIEALERFLGNAVPTSPSSAAVPQYEIEQALDQIGL
jgi:hypothetical protein